MIDTQVSLNLIETDQNMCLGYQRSYPDSVRAFIRAKVSAIEKYFSNH